MRGCVEEAKGEKHALMRVREALACVPRSLIDARLRACVRRIAQVFRPAENE